MAQSDSFTTIVTILIILLIKLRRFSSKFNGISFFDRLLFAGYFFDWLLFDRLLLGLKYIKVSTWSKFFDVIPEYYNCVSNLIENFVGSKLFCLI